MLTVSVDAGFCGRQLPERSLVSSNCTVMWQQSSTGRLERAFATFLLIGNPDKVLALIPGGGADASDIHGLKTGSQHPDNATPAVADTGPNAASTVPATAGYSGTPSLCARLWITHISQMLRCMIPDAHRRWSSATF